MTEGNLPAKRGVASNTVQAWLAKRGSELSNVLPKAIDPKRFATTVLQLIRGNPDLEKCSAPSLILGILTGAQAGLSFAKGLQEAHLVPFRNGKTGTMEAVFIPDYRGLIKLARQSGMVLDIYAYPVYEGDEFDYNLGTDIRITHRENPDTPREDNNLKAVYAVAVLPGGIKQIRVMWRSEIDKARANSRAAKSGPWVQYFVPMALKTVIKRLVNMLPKDSEQLVKAMAVEDRYEAEGEGAKPEDVEGVIDLGDLTDSAPWNQEGADEPPPPAATEAPSSRPSMPKPANGTKKPAPPPEDDRPPDRPPEGMFGRTDPLG